jgi:hypothetical protein
VAEQPVIVLPLLAGGQAESWAALVELAPAFGDNWLLVGGQMVFLHELERQSIEVRPTDDIDVVVDLRAEPAGLARIHSALISASFDQDEPGPEGTAHRYRRFGAVIDVLAPDNIGKRAQLTLGSGRTIEAPGTSQAFHRSGIVSVEIEAGKAEIRRPNLVGALIGKASAVAKISSQSAASRAKHLRDFDSLAQMLGPRDRATADLSKSERKLLGQLTESQDVTSLGRAAIGVLMGQGNV